MSSDEESDLITWKGGPASIILINIYDPAEKNTALIAHDVTCRVIRQYLRASSDNFVGVCLYGIEKSGSSILDTKDTMDVIKLNTVSLETYKVLKNLDINQITQAKDLLLSDVLWHCHSMFRNFKKMVSSRDIIILSRLDTPPISSDQDKALNRISKLVELNINIKLINIADDMYDVHPFYRKFLIEAKRQKDVTVPKPLWDPLEIQLSIIRQSNRHLAVAQLGFEIGNDVTIGVGVYKILKSYESTRIKSCKVDRDTNAVVKSYNQLLKVVPSDAQEDESDNNTVQSAVPLLKSELLHYKMFGEENIYFSDAEMKMIRNPFGPPLLRLLGFKPLGYLCKEKWFLQSGYFLYPNEKKIDGSTVAFKALYEACKSLSVVAICVLCTRVNAKPQIVALSPCSHPLNLDVEIGFDVIAIPFIESVRDVPAPNEDEEVLSNAEHKTFLKSLLDNLKFEYQPNIFENPVLQSQYQALEAMKIGDEIEPFVDTTKPNPERFENIQDDLFYELFGPFGSVVAKRTTSAAGVNSKKSKLEEYNDDLVQEAIRSNNLNSFKVDQLKDILKYHKVKVALNGLKKAELIKLINEHCTKS